MLVHSRGANCDTPHMARKLRRIERVEFSGDGYTLVIAHMARLVDAGDGWINLIPKIADDYEETTSLGFLTLVGGGASGVTMCTWIPASHDHRGRSQASIGITHVTGRRAGPELHTSGAPIPETWLVEQDHPRRGLVVRFPGDEPNEQVLVWALRAVATLSAPRDIRRWRGDIYNPATL